VFNGTATLQGQGFSCSGPSTQFSSTVNFYACYFYNLATAVNYGNYTQAIILSQCTILNCTAGVVVAAGLSGLDELQIIGCDISCVTACVSMLTAVPTFMVTGSFIQVPVGNAGLYLNVHNLFSITGNVFSGEPSGTSGQIGIYAGTTAGSVGGVISGNAFYALVGSAISLASTTTNIVVHNNMYNLVGTKVVNANATGNEIAGGFDAAADQPLNMVLGSGNTAVQNVGIMLRSQASDRWNIYKGTDNNFRITNVPAATDSIEIDANSNVVSCPSGVATAYGATWLGGTAAPSYTAPVGSLFSRINGTVGATLYVSRGGGVWAAVAGV
jgi:hypothetical protein